jgi:hypothetical protein
LRREKGLGKSVLTNSYISARLTKGELDGEFLEQPMDVAIATAEDDWRSVVVPRLMAHGAGLDRVHRLDLFDADGRSLFTLPDDVAAVEAAIGDLQRSTGRTIGMLVIDPITAFLSSETDSHRDASVRRALFPLAGLAERMDLAVVVVGHLTKDQNRELLSRVTGSGAFVNAARAVLVLGRDPDDPDGEDGSRRVLVMAATNWGKIAASLAWHIETVTVQTDEGPTEQPVLVLDGECEVHAGDVQRGAPNATGEEVEDAGLVALRDGKRPGADVKREVSSDLRVSLRTVERAAERLELGKLLDRSRSGYPAVATWALAPVATPPDATRVATEETRANAGDSGVGSVSCDTPPCRVATEPDDRTLVDAECLAILPASRPLDPSEPPHDPLCAYPVQHAGSAWRKEGGPWRCGVCHPPASPDLVAEWAA